MRDVTRIELGFKTEDGKKIFFVKDNGIGFNMGHHDKLFLPFQQIHPKEKFLGTGMGLAIVSKIIKRHGGKIWAESKLNEGSVFYFTLGLDDI